MSIRVESDRSNFIRKINWSENVSCPLDLASVMLASHLFGLAVDFFALNKWHDADQAQGLWLNVVDFLLTQVSPSCSSAGVDQWPFCLFTSLLAHTYNNMAHLPSPGLSQISLCRWVYGSPILISRSTTEFSPMTQIKVMLITSKNYAQACNWCEKKLLFFHGLRNCKWNTSIYRRSSHLVWAHKSHFVQSHAKSKQKNAFKFEGFNWYWTVRDGCFQNFYYHCIIKTYIAS